MKNKLEELKEAIQLEVRKSVFLREFTDGNGQVKGRGMSAFTAVRNLKVSAQGAALKFEEQIVKELGLVNQDQMDELSQQVYHQATSKLMDVFTSAVVDCVQSMEGLPKAESESAPSAPQSAKVTF